jgi:hypothetical protein
MTSRLRHEVYGQDWMVGTIEREKERFAGPSGSNDHLIDGACHYASDRLYRNHALTRARSTIILSALACRTRLSNRFADNTTSQQALAPVTVAEGPVRCSHKTGSRKKSPAERLGFLGFHTEHVHAAYGAMRSVSVSL